MANYIQWKAPEDFTPFYVEINVETDKDGLLGNYIQCTRYVGNYNPDADEKKLRDMNLYDYDTVLGVLSRLSMTTYATNVARRLTPNANFTIIMRIRKDKENNLAVTFKEIWKEYSVKVKGKKKQKMVQLEKSDPEYRAFRKSSRIIPCAFKECKPAPTLTEMKEYE